MDIRRLRYFIAAAEEENLHRAADRLHIVQPALSKQIAALEGEIGCELFVQSKGRMHLTPAGFQYLADARRILREVQLATERAQQTAAGQIGRLRIGFRETAGRLQVVSRTFSEFRTTYPNIEMQLNPLTSPAQCDALRADELDAGFVYLSPEHDHALERLPLAIDYFFLALYRGHRLATQRHIHLRDLVDESFIWLARSRHAYYSEALLRDCHQGGLYPKIIQEADSEATSLNLVAVGMGISFVVAPNAVSPLPDVIYKPVAELSTGLTLALVWNPITSTAITKNFIASVKSVKRKFKNWHLSGDARASHKFY